MIHVEVQNYQGKEQTGKGMYDLCRTYWSDLGMAISMPLAGWFDRVRKIPYRADSELFPEDMVEVISRPAYLLNPRVFPALDCKKKAVLLGAYAEPNGIPYRFVACSEKPNGDIHHVFPQLKLGGEWVNADATLPEFFLGQGKMLTHAEVLSP